MDTAFEKQSYMDHKLIWSGAIGGEENAECVVPDSMPDLGVILDAEAVLSLRSKELGGGRLTVQADIAVKLLYQPEGESVLRSLSVNMSSSLTAPATAEDDCMALVRLRVRSVEGKIVNSRKAAVRVELTGMGYCYRKERLELIGGVTASDTGVETLCARQMTSLVSDVREKTFVVTDDIPLPAALDEVDGILSQRVMLRTDETEFAGDKLVFRGRAFCFLLLQREDGVFPCSYEAAFSQIMEIEGETECAPEIILSLTGAYFDLPDHSGGKLGLELHLLAQVVCRRQAELAYVADAYSNRRRIEPVFGENVLCSEQRPLSLRHTVSCTADAPHDAGDILFAKGRVSSVSVCDEGVEVSVNFRAVYRRADGGYGCVSRRVQEVVPALPEEGEMLLACGAFIENVFSTVGANGIELRASVELDLRAQRMTTLSHLTGLAIGEEPLPDVPSLTLLRCGGEEELWPLAKAHRSTCAAIREANDGRCEGLLLIPKCR